MALPVVASALPLSLTHFKHQQMKKVIDRAKKPTPPFFKKVRKVGLILAGVAGAILTAPVSFPAAVTTLAGYVAVAGGVASAISQLTVDEDRGSHKK